MDILTLTLSILLAGLALGIILYPLWQQYHAEAILLADPAEQTLENYEARYQAAISAIKVLMFDYEMGKVSEADYQTLLSKTKLEAAQIRRQIDHLSQEQLSVTDIDAALDAEIENLVAQLRNDRRNGNESLLQEVNAEIELLKNTPSQKSLACPNCAKRVRPEDAFCSGCGQSLDGLKSANESACPECGAEIQPEDAFCAQCGAALNAVAVQEASEEAGS